MSKVFNFFKSLWKTLNPASRVILAGGPEEHLCSTCALMLNGFTKIHTFRKKLKNLEKTWNFTKMLSRATTGRPLGAEKSLLLENRKVEKSPFPKKYQNCVSHCFPIHKLFLGVPGPLRKPPNSQLFAKKTTFSVIPCFTRCQALKSHSFQVFRSTFATPRAQDGSTCRPSTSAFLHISYLFHTFPTFRISNRK